MFECGSNPQESVHTEFRSGSVQNAFEGYIANNGVFIHREHKGEHACVGDGDVDSVRFGVLRGGLAFPCPRAATNLCLPILEGKTRGF